MLESMRAATQGRLGRAVLTVVLGLIILSFAIWGIGDIFRGFGANKLAEVGRQEISTEAFRAAYQTELQRLQRQARRAITNDEARRFGVDRQVLSRMIGEAVLDQETHALGLAISDAEIGKAIMDDPAFKGPSGQFDRARFDEVLRDNGFNESSFVREQRGVYLRQELVGAMTNGLDLPKAMLDAIHRFQGEARAIDYFLLPASAVGEIAAPPEDELRKFFDERRQAYSTPELRSLVVLSLTPESAAKPELVSDEDARKRYEEIKGEKFGAPEKRRVDQLFFPDETAAKAARDKLDGGATFEEVAAQAGASPKDFALGLVSRAQMVDPAAADVAFQLPDGAVSAPVKTAFGYVLLRVSEIEPSTAKPFEEVRDEVKRDVAVARARGDITRLHDAVEDQRASGHSLVEAAKAAGLEATALPPLDAAGKDEAGAPVARLVNAPALLKAAFASDVGVDNETLSLPQGGYQWFEVSKVERAREKSFEEARAQVEKDWRDRETAKRMGEKAADLTKQLDGGAPIAALAAESGAALKRAEGVTRGGGGDFPQPAVAQVFNVRVGGAGAAEFDDGRLVFKVAGSSAPPVDYAAPGLASIADQVKRSYLDDLMGEYLAAAQTKLGVTINSQAFAAATGAAQGY
ncbi:SurA N-terminal domain-containing protein [Methylocella sp.]|uniref:SurA N-terminal domain-containing protein n=1 Tax=Methylocella sp. TaxID=1978226 RepID=UPI0035B3E33F